MDKIALIAFFISLIMTAIRSPKIAFIYVYLPFLLLFPTAFEMIIPGFRDLNFCQLAIIPIFFGLLFYPQIKGKSMFYQFGLTDILVLGFIFFSILSEYYNTGHYPDERGTLWANLSVYLFLSVWLPYLLGKILIYQNKLFVTFAKTYVIILVSLICLSAYEWRFVVNPFIAYLGKFFPHITLNYIPSFRFGMARITGPFPHAILFGIGIAIAIFLNVWLTRNRYWKKNLSFLPLFVISKGTLITLILGVGLFFTLSRGPLYSTLLGLVFFGIGFSRHKALSLTVRLVILGVLGIIALNLLSYYTTVDKDLSGSPLVGTAVYRIEMIKRYMEIVQQRLWWGWGSVSFQKVDQYVSIDNHYLWLTLKHGVIALGLLITIIVMHLVPLFSRGMKAKSRKESSFAFTLFSILLMIVISSVTVYMGGQIETLFFLMIGISRSYLRTKASDEDYLPNDRIPKKEVLAVA